MTLKIVTCMLFSFLTLTNCSDKIDEKSIVIDAEQVAILQCEAKQLRNERFEAANRIRLKEESMLQKGESLIASDILQNDSIAKNLSARTAQLASKINTILDSLWKNKYKTVEKRQKLDTAVEKIVAVKCPG